MYRLHRNVALPSKTTAPCLISHSSPLLLLGKYPNGKVDKSKFATNAFDKEFLLGKTFGGGGHYNANEDRRQGQS